MTLLAGQTAVVTGAGRGLGAVIARELWRAGARVLLVGRKPEPLAELLRTAQAEGATAATLVLDVTAPGAGAALVAAAERELGGLDLLVNNAGAYTARPFLELTEADWQNAFETNSHAPFRLLQAMAKHLVGKGRRGCVVNIGSIHGRHADGDAVAQCASKAALDALTRASALALAPYGIRVVAVAPGAIREASGEVRSSGPAESVTQLDVAQLVVVVASPQASSVSGSVLEAYGATQQSIDKASGTPS